MEGIIFDKQQQRIGIKPSCGKNASGSAGLLPAHCGKPWLSWIFIRWGVNRCGGNQCSISGIRKRMAPQPFVVGRRQQICLWSIVIEDCYRAVICLLENAGKFALVFHFYLRTSYHEDMTTSCVKYLPFRALSK